MRFSLLLAILALGQAGPLRAQTGIERYLPPSPQPSGFIHDGGPVLAPADKSALNQRILALQATGRGDIGVAILRDIGDYSANEVATAIGRAWKVGAQDSIGSERRDLGTVLLIVPKELSPNGEGQCYIATSTGAEGFITDSRAADICRDDIIPHLRERDYPAAIGAGIDAIAAEVSSIETRGVAGTPAGGSGGGGNGGLIAGVIGLSLLGGGGGAVAWRRHKRRKPRLCPQGHGPMRLLDEKADDAALQEGQRKEESVKSVDYDVWECAECGERLVLRYKRWFTSYTQCPSCTFWTVKSKTRTLVPATRVSGGLVETTKTCQNCSWTETRQHATPRITSSSSSGSRGGGGSGGSSFGGSGRFAGGGGGGRY